jgi:hypothetical protein
LTLPQSAFDVLQHEHQAQRYGDVSHVDAACGGLKIVGDYAPRRPVAVIRGQVPQPGQ